MHSVPQQSTSNASDIPHTATGFAVDHAARLRRIANEDNLQEAIRILRQQEQEHNQRLHIDQARSIAHQDMEDPVTREFTRKLQQQLQQIVQQSQRQQGSRTGESTSASIGQQHPMPNPLQPAGLLAASQPDQQKRKRGRPPLSAPSTSTATTPADFNYWNIVNAMKNQQQERLQQDRQRELRQQQAERERQRESRIAQERAERQRELRLQQEREKERQRAELERQRKTQHRMALQDIDRERRRYHSIMVKNLDAYKKNEERERSINAMVAESKKNDERRKYQKRLEVELIKDIRKPIDDMMLKNHKPLATLNRIPGLKLPGKAFADLLMSYEFLFNFGETVGLELKQVPDINTLQIGLLNLDSWAEDQLISILHHLCVFAIKDPRFPYTGSTKEIESLEKTNEGLSQLLHFYLQVLTLNSRLGMEHEWRLFRLIEAKYFLSLNATQKAEMLAFVCNELLCSSVVTKQMEDTIENVAKLRKDKWVLENELRKYRAIKTKREIREEAGLRAKEAAAAAQLNGDEKVEEESKEQIKSEVEHEVDDKSVNKTNLTNGSTAIDSKREIETDTSTQNNAADFDDPEPGMTNEELNKKIENSTRQYNKTSNKLEKAIYSMRACPLGQDRFRRRYWVLPQVGGVFVEGMESSEPEELENNKFSEEELLEYEREQQILEELTNNEESIDETSEKLEIKTEKDDEDMAEENADAPETKEEDEAMDLKDEEGVEGMSELKEEEPKAEVLENGESEVDKVPTEMDHEEMNPIAQMPSIPWFSILPRNSCDFSKSSQLEHEANEIEEQKKAKEEDLNETKAELTSEELRAMRYEICPTLAKRLEELEAEQYDTPKKIHPQFQCGWWRITDAQQLKAILTVLHERGSRERLLHKHLTKYFQYACSSCKNTTVDFEITGYDRQLAGKNYGAPIAHTDEDSADDLKEGEEEVEEEEDIEEFEDETGDDKVVQQAATAPTKKSKRRKVSRSARSRRLRARAAAKKKVENSKNKLAQR